MAEDEVTALNLRVEAAWSAAHANNSWDALNAFSLSVAGQSEAVICRDLGTLDALEKSENIFYVNYHRQVRASVRDPQDNRWDSIRQQVDAALFPNYFEDIFFASLSLNGQGDENYGLYFLTLKETMVRMRSSVFEENSILFADRHGLRLTDPIPPGYRATWQQRHFLAISKLHDQVTPSSGAVDFPAILFTPGGGGEAEFIEIHIHGRLGAASIESVSGARPSAAEDKVLWRSVQRRLKKLGIAVQER